MEIWTWFYTNLFTLFAVQERMAKGDTKRYLFFLGLWILQKSPRLLRFLERMVSKPWFPKFLVKATIFPIFCGGENETEIDRFLNKTKDKPWTYVLNYGAEMATSETESIFNSQKIVDSIAFAAQHQPSVSAICVKLSSVVPYTHLVDQSFTSMPNITKRLETIWLAGNNNHIPLWVDAEESWIQDGIDVYLLKLLPLYNKEKPSLWLTLQTYRKDAFEKVKSWIQHAQVHGYQLGIKVVRGAYVEQERTYAHQQGKLYPLWETKPDTDKCFRSVLEILVSTPNVHFCMATHNETDMEWFFKQNLAKTTAIAQLYGMGDRLVTQATTSPDTMKVYKYLPYGPVAKVIPYLIRRSQENSAMTEWLEKELAYFRPF